MQPLSTLNPLSPVASGQETLDRGKLAALNCHLSDIVSDLEELSREVQECPDGQQPENTLHAFYQLTIYRTTALLNDLADVASDSRVLEAVQRLRSEVGVIRWVPEFAKNFGVVEARLWEVIHGVALASEDFHLRHYGGTDRPAPESVIKSIAELSNRLVVPHPEARSPQKGFSRTLSLDEISGILDGSDTHLFILSHAGQDAGFFVFSQSDTKIPMGARQIFSTQNFEGEEQCAGWLPIVGIAENARHILREKGIDAYDLMTSLIAQKATTLGIAVLYGAVRVGENANTAIRSHLRVGFQPTGLRYKEGDHEYEVLSLRPDNVEFYGSDSLISLMGSSHAQNPSLELPTLREALESWNFRSPDSVKPDEYCIPNGDWSMIKELLQKELPHSIKYNIEKLSDGYAIILFDGPIITTFRQILPNQDLWLFDAYGKQKALPLHLALESFLKDSH